MATDGGFQFFREEGYALVRGQGRPSTGTGKQARGEREAGRRSARDIIGEAIRAEGDHPHVAAPRPPRVLHGVPADELLTWYEQLEDLARRQVVDAVSKLGKPIKRRQRSDTPVLIGAIASYPGPADDADPGYVAWRDKVMAFARRRYGDRIVSVIEHTDEPHGHIHILVADAGRSIKPLMAGHGAQLAALAAGMTKKEAAAAYKSATRALQDDFYAAVSIEVGLTRLGPGGRSLPRPAWQREKASARAIAHAIAKAKEDEAAAIAAAEAAAEQRRKLVDAQVAVQAQAAVVERARRALLQDQRRVQQLVEALTPAEQERAARRLADIEARDAAAARAKNAPATPAAKTPPAAGSIKRSVPR